MVCNPVDIVVGKSSKDSEATEWGISIVFPMSPLEEFRIKSAECSGALTVWQTTAPLIGLSSSPAQALQG